MYATMGPAEPGLSNALSIWCCKEEDDLMVFNGWLTLSCDLSAFFSLSNWWPVMAAEAPSRQTSLQGVQSLAFALFQFALELLAGQGVHDWEPVVEKLPGGHEPQDVAPSATLEAVMAVPAGHLTQDPVLSVKFPTPQVAPLSLTHSLLVALPRGLRVFGGHLAATGVADVEPSTHQ